MEEEEEESIFDPNSDAFLVITRAAAVWEFAY